ncbi:hypothetical protein HK102_010971 [Quaeritorhiza haematococci]|nr:hypothetical protein HK102_010971 [Quaeritorhiza haematococci]
MDETYDKLISTVHEYVERLDACKAAHRRQLERGNSEFIEDVIKEELGKGGLLLSNAATKLSLTASHGSRDAIHACRAVAESCDYIVTLVEAIPASVGKTALEDLLSLIKSILVEVAVLANRFLSNPRSTAEVTRGYLPSTGIIWKACDVLKEVSLDNRIVCAKRVKSSFELIEDALSELVETMADEGDGFGGGDDDDDLDELGLGGSGGALTPEEKEIAEKCVRLGKLVKLLLKKGIKVLTQVSMSDVVDEEKLLELMECMDRLVDLSRQCAVEMDELVCTIESPITVRNVASRSTLVGEIAEKFCQEAKQLAGSDSQGWFDTCSDQLMKVVKEIAGKDVAR